MGTGSKTLFDAAMELQASDIPNVRQAVPLFNVKDIEASLCGGARIYDHATME
jgi:hypothetical protein